MFPYGSACVMFIPAVFAVYEFVEIAQPPSSSQKNNSLQVR